MRTPQPQWCPPAVTGNPQTLYAAIIRAFCTRWTACSRSSIGVGSSDRCCTDRADVSP